jgi:DNA-binding GntR family transcriptional regulator
LTAGMSPRPLGKVVSVQRAALQMLREQIAAGVLPAGAQLRQELLAREVGVSVAPVREALKTLEAEGQVVYLPRRGYFVASLTLSELVENYRIRDLLEPEAVRQAIPRLGDEQIARMEQSVDEMEDASRRVDLQAFGAANRIFHFTIFESAGMPRLAEFIRILWESTDPYRARYIVEDTYRCRVNTEHRAILETVRLGDSRATLRLLQKHRTNARDAIGQFLQGMKAPGGDAGK